MAKIIKIPDIEINFDIGYEELPKTDILDLK